MNLDFEGESHLSVCPLPGKQDGAQTWPRWCHPSTPQKSSNTLQDLLEQPETRLPPFLNSSRPVLPLFILFCSVFSTKLFIHQMVKVLLPSLFASALENLSTHFPLCPSSSEPAPYPSPLFLWSTSPPPHLTFVWPSPPSLCAACLLVSFLWVIHLYLSKLFLKTLEHSSTRSPDLLSSLQMKHQEPQVCYRWKRFYPQSLGGLLSNRN